MKIETAREYLKRLWICEAPKGTLTTNDVVEAMEEYAKYREESKGKKFHKPLVSNSYMDKIKSWDDGGFSTGLNSYFDDKQ